MLNDIKRHFKKHGVKITLVIFLLNTAYIFFKDGNITIMGIIAFLVISLLGFLMFSWGFDNPEEGSTKNKRK